MAPVFAQRLGVLKFLALPIDNGKTINGKPIFGANKTWRGLIVGTTIAIVTAWLQYFLYSIQFFQKISLVNYPTINLWLLGFLFGFGALFGDLVKSFFKRRFSVSAGEPWIPFDQIDFVIGALVLVAFIYRPPLAVVVAVVLISPILHILTNNIGYYLKIKSTRW